jgi:extracellular factor (EF) 3-hydroxypalmitic acid methyl ester biosynthesis protein
MDRLGFEERLVATVWDRKEYLRRQIQAVAEAAAGTAREVRVVSLGCGPAREVEDHLREAPRVPRMVVTLVDQEEAAIEFADQRLSAAALRHGDAVRISGRHVSFRQLLSNEALLEEASGQDLVYSAGLLDYLSKPVARDLIRRCARQLRSGGILLFGNAVSDPAVRWVPELVLDWHLNLRTAAEMRALAPADGGGLATAVEADGSAAWHFLRLERA